MDPRTASRKLMAIGAVLLGATALPADLLAQLQGPVYPPPGGVSFSASGPGSSAGRASGRANRYVLTDPSQYDDLFWTFTQIANPWHSSQSSPSGLMQFLGYSASTGIATWASTRNVVYSTAFGTQSFGTFLRAQFQPYNASQLGILSSGWLTPVLGPVDPDGAGPASPYPLWPMVDVAAQTPDQFQVWYRFEHQNGTALLDFYDNSHSLGGSLNTSISGGFYYTEPTVVPEPMSLALLGTGLAGLGALRRRRRRQGEAG